MDVAVSTPDSLQRFRREGIWILFVLLSRLAKGWFFPDTGRIDLSDLSHLVIDEADTLLDDSFAEAVDAIMKHIQVRKV